jgi:hypothetical protein
MEIPTGVENALKIVDELIAAGLNRVVHQHFGIAHDGDCGCTQFLPDVGNKCTLGSSIGWLVNSIGRGTVPPPQRASIVAGAIRSSGRGTKESRHLA